MEKDLAENMLQKEEKRKK